MWWGDWGDFRCLNSALFLTCGFTHLGSLMKVGNGVLIMVKGRLDVNVHQGGAGLSMLEPATVRSGAKEIPEHSDSDP